MLGLASSGGEYRLVVGRQSMRGNSGDVIGANRPDMAEGLDDGSGCAARGDQMLRRGMTQRACPTRSGKTDRSSDGGSSQ